jgi:hypothetical protein
MWILSVFTDTICIKWIKKTYFMEKDVDGMSDLLNVRSSSWWRLSAAQSGHLRIHHFEGRTVPAKRTRISVTHICAKGMRFTSDLRLPVIDTIVWVCQFPLEERIIAMPLRLVSKINNDYGQPCIYTAEFVQDDPIYRKQQPVLHIWLESQYSWSEEVRTMYDQQMKGTNLLRKKQMNALY